MAKKREEIGNEIDGGKLTHNPFAALGGNPKGAKPASRAESPRQRAKPEPPTKLVVRHEAKGHGGKTVTRVSGLGGDSKTLESLAKDLRKAMGTGARLEDGDILVQGKLVERVADWLQSKGHGPVVRGN